MFIEAKKPLDHKITMFGLLVFAIITIGVALVAATSSLIVYGLLIIPFVIGVSFFFFIRPIRALFAFIFLLPIHSLVLTILIAQLGLSINLVKVVASWKEILLLCTFIVVVSHRFIQRRPFWVNWVDYIALLWLALIVVYFLFHDLFFSWESNLTIRLYGARDWLLYLIPYFIGRLIVVSDKNASKIFKSLLLVAFLTSIIGIFEYFFVPIEWHIKLGVPRYFGEFLGLEYPEHWFGLPPNYWTSIGGLEVRRSVSTYLSGQGFALTFLLIIPVVTYNYFIALRRASLSLLLLCWIALLLTITRMTILVCFIQSMTVLWFCRKTKRLTLVLIGTMLILTAIFVINSTIRNYIIQTLTFQDDSGRTRPGQWLAGIEAIVEHPLGLGLGSVGQVGARFANSGVGSEAGYFKITGALGLLGLLFFCGWFLGILAHAYRLYRKLKLHDPHRALILVTLVTAIGFLLNNITAPPDQSIFVLYVFSWLAGLTVQRAASWHFLVKQTNVHC